MLDRDPTTSPPAGGNAPPPDPPPLHVRALDAFEAFYRQLGAVSQRRVELRAALATDSIPSVVLAAADLNSALGVLYARLELLEAVTNDDAGRDLWTHPMMELMRSQMRTLLEDGIAYVSRHPEGGRVLEQLRHLAVTLAAEAKVAKGIVGETLPEPGQCVTVVVDRPGAGLRARCRMRRPWRRPARHPDRRDPQ
jgi:hypothetical protein